MASAKISGKSNNTWNKIKNEVDKKIRQQEVSATIRESRQGYRGFGMFQLTKFYSAEGVHVVDVGGPAVVGR